MEKYKSLEIMRYNKKLQKRLNISINDYKEYYQSTEIELKIVDYRCDKFINIPDKEKKYYHIYFNNSNEEIKGNYLNENEKVKIIKIIIDYKVTSFQNLFYYCWYIEFINFKKFYRNNVTNMSDMFAHCSPLKELNLSNFNTNNVTNMKCMFYKCSSLKELKVSSFIINDEVITNDMFYGCHDELKKVKFIVKNKSLKLILINLSFLILLISLIYYFK